MTLRFQNQRDDEIDRAAKLDGRTALVFVLVLLAVVEGVSAWIRGDNLSAYVKYLGFSLAFGYAFWILAPLYHEFRIRAKEIDGKVSAIEGTVAALKGDCAELLERLAAIEKKLDSIREDQEQVR